MRILALNSLMDQRLTPTERREKGGPMQSIGATIKQLQRMSVGELRQQWEEVFGEPCRSNNKD